MPDVKRFGEGYASGSVPASEVVAPPAALRPHHSSGGVVAPVAPAPASVVQAGSLTYAHLGGWVELRIQIQGEKLVRVEGPLKYIGFRHDAVGLKVAFTVIDVHPSHKITIREVA